VPYISFAFTDRALDFLDGLQPKIRRQVAKTAKALHATPFPPGSKKLKDVETPEGDPVYRGRSGDYRILYIVRSNSSEILVLDIDHRKDVYRMPKTKGKPADEMCMKESDFDQMMSKALAAPPPSEHEDNEEKRLSAYPRKPKRKI